MKFKTKEKTIRVEESPKWDNDINGSFIWPEGVTISFPDGEEWDDDCGRDQDGVLIAPVSGTTGALGSPLGQILTAAGFLK